MSVMTRGVRNAFRNPVRTVSIVLILGLSVGMALAMLVARQAVTAKIESVKSSVGNMVSVSPAGSRGFEGGGNALTTEQAATLEKLAHVSSVDQSLSDRLTSENTTLESAVEAGSLGRRFSQNNGTGFSGGERSGRQAPPSIEDNMGNSSESVTRTFTPPVTVVGTTNPENLSGSAGGGSLTLKSGKVFEVDSNENVAIVGSGLAEKNNLRVGSTFTAYDKTITVVGIFDAGNTFGNNQVLMPLKALQTLSDQADAVTSMTLHVDSVDNAAAVTTAAKTALGDAADVTNDAETAAQSVAPLQNIATISFYSLIGAVVAGAVIILLAMVMIVRERRREIGVLKAIGASNVKVVGQFASEAVTLTLLGAVIGIALGIVAGNPITKLLVNNASSATTQTMGQMGGRGAGRVFGEASRSLANIQVNIGWDIILYGLAVAVAIALVGSVLASFFIAKVRPAEVMRAE